MEEKPKKQQVQKTVEEIDLNDYISHAEVSHSNNEDWAATLPSEFTEPPQSTVPTVPSDPLRRVSAKQRKVSLEEYREQFMTTPKITDRQPVFVSRTTRDRIDEIVRRFGERKMSVSGFLENIARHHLTLYNEDVEQWKRL